MTKTKSGFTIVELLIVIVVIGILATITIVAYGGIQSRAQDARIKDAASKVSQAIQIWSVDRGGQLPTGSGYGSTASSGDGVCTGGAGGFAGKGFYVCALEDMLVDSKLLPANFISSLPPNKNYGGTGAYSMMFYPCTAVGTNTFALYYYLGSPSPEDTSGINDIVTRCGQSGNRDTNGMRGARLLTF